MARTKIKKVGESIGDVVNSLLSEAEFQDQRGPGWVLADGRSVTGSSYEAITGNSNVPDMRGQFLRGKNNGRTDGNENPDGDLALGTYQADEFEAHYHGNSRDNSVWQSGGSSPTNVTTRNQNVAQATVGGNETRAKNITVNIFIKID